MKDRIFIDTNVLVYIHLFDEESQDKRKALQNLLHSRIDAESYTTGKAGSLNV